MTFGDDCPPDVIRKPEEVARRALTLFGTVGLALGADRSDILSWLKDNDLWRDLSQSEMEVVSNPIPEPRQIIHFGWMSERLIVVLWAMEAIEALPPANEQCDTAVFQDILPPFAAVSVQDFISSAHLRPDEVLTDLADEMLALHWEARDAKLHGHAPRRPVDIEVVQERHHAINWVIGYCGEPWDMVTTDT